MRNFISIIILLLFNSFLLANNYQITGQIFDLETQLPLSNVNIEIITNNRGTYTDSTGFFIFKNLIEDKINLKISRIGYISISKTIDHISLQNNYNYYLKPTILQLQTININASSKYNPIDKPQMESLSINQTIIHINQQEINKQNSATIIDAMNFIPSGHTESRGRKVKQFFSIRGQQYPYPDISINGIVLKEFHESTYFFHAANIDKIEIIPTTSAILKGFSPMAGIINVKTTQFTNPTTLVNMEYGSFNSIKSNISHGTKKNNLSYSTSLSFTKTDGPEKKHAAEKISNLYGHIKYQPRDNFHIQSDIFYIKGYRELALAEMPASKKFLNLIQEYDPINTLLTNIKIYHKQSSKSASEVYFYYSNRKPELKVQNNPDSPIQKFNEYDTEFGGKWIQSLNIFPNNYLKLATSFTQWYAPEGKRFFIGKECKSNTYSAIITNEHKFENLSINTGLRFDREYFDKYGAFNIDGSSVGFKKVTAINNEWQQPIIISNFGINYDLNTLNSFSINFAYGQIDSRKGSLNSDFQKPQNEKQTKFDFTLKNHSNYRNLSISGFYTYQKDAIILNGKTFTDSATGLIHEFYENRNQFNQGIELAFRSHRIYNIAELFFNSTIMQSKYDEINITKINKRFPQILLNSGLYADYKNFDLNFFLKYVSKYENDRFSDSGMQPLGDYTHIDISAGYTAQKLNNSRIYLHIKNLINMKYSSVVGYPDFGREIKIGINIKIL